MATFEKILALSALAACSFTFASGCSSLNQMIQDANKGKETEQADANAAADTKAEEPAAAEAPAEIPPPEPNPELRASLLKCNSSVTPTDVQTGVVGKYKFTEGMATSERTGFIDKKPLEMTDGCFLGEMQPGACVSWTVNEEKYKALGNSNDWEVQCVYSDDPGAGVIKNPNEYPYSMESMKTYYFMLMCNHDQGDGYECAEGSNSMRGGKWREKLDAEGKLQMGFCAPSGMLYQETAYEDKDFPGGRWVYCQYYNKQSNESMVGFEFLQTVRN